MVAEPPPRGIMTLMAKLKRTYSKFRSHWWALSLMERRIRRGINCTTTSLAEELEVTPRTLRRYLATLRDEMGCPVVFDRESKSFKLSNPTWSMPNIHLADAEVQTMAIAIQAVRPVMPAPFPELLDNLLAKLLDALPEDDRDEILRIQSSVEFVPAPVLSKGTQWFEQLLQAIRRQLSVDMTYYVLGKDQETQRRFDPYYLRNYQGTWYVVGYDHRTQYWPILNLARIRALTVSDDLYRVRSFSAAEYFKDTLGVMVGGTPQTVRIRLTGYAADTADERIWPPGFTYKATRPGEGILSGALANMTDLLQWASAFQCDAEILSEVPAELPNKKGR